MMSARQARDYCNGAIGANTCFRPRPCKNPTTLLVINMATGTRHPFADIQKFTRSKRTPAYIIELLGSASMISPLNLPMPRMVALLLDKIFKGMFLGG